MIDTKALRSRILDLAIQGKLTQQLDEDDIVSDILKAVPAISAKRKTLLKKNFDYDFSFDIPANWKWVRLGEISSYGDSPTKAMTSEMNPNTWILELEDIKAGGELLQKKRVEISKSIGEKTVFSKGQVLYSKLRPYLKKVLVADEDGISTPELISFDVYADISAKYIVFCLINSFVDNAINRRSYGVKMPRVDVGFMVNLPIPLPPLAEQKRIVQRVEEIFKLFDTIDEAQMKYSSDSEILKSKLISMGIQGELTEQLESDGNAEELYQKIQIEKQRLIKDEKISFKPIESIPNDMQIKLPRNWKMVRFGDIAYIVRGGSPRPIKAYITNSDDGINWIKIGDVEKGGKYIYSTKEKIIPEGEKKSRRVYPGDFLLTNSMSFGRPYISKIEGCIHDGWLLIRNMSGFNIDFLYYLLSSNYLYSQFSDKASGSTVENLNIDKVNSALIPLPPLAEQKRIVEILERLLKAIG